LISLYKFNKKLVIRLLLFFLFSVSPIFPKEIYIGGQVLNIKTKESISDVNVYIPGTTIGITTDKEGYFYLRITDTDSTKKIIFDHIAYDSLHVKIAHIKKEKVVYLNPKIMKGTGITVEAERDPPEIAKDLPQTISIIDAKKFENQGYIDAGDLLKTEQSIQIEEEISGKKTIAIRGGNSDDVVVLYNGVKMNNPYDNTFDLSLINLDDVKKIEIIKGSNTVLYGSDAFSGVINIVPNIYRDYSVKFSQRFGTYDSGDWNLQLNRTLKNRLHVSISNKSGGSRKTYADSPDKSEFLENKSSHQIANIVFTPSNKLLNDAEDIMSAMYMRSDLNYKNNRFYEEISDLNQLVYFRYVGSIGPVNNLKFVGSYQWLENEQQLPTVTGLFTRSFFNQSFKFNLEKKFEFNAFNFLLAYNFEDSQLDFQDKRNYLDDIPVGLESVTLTSQKHGFASILKLHTPTGTEFMKTADIDASLRYDKVVDQQKDVVARNRFNELDYFAGKYDENKWDESMLKLSAHFSGSRDDFNYNVFLSTGSNFKFPSLFQQLSSPSLLNINSPEIVTSLNPEKNLSTEIGIEIKHNTTKNLKIDNWELNLSYFTNIYENKFRLYYTPGVPVSFYDNVSNADITGIEGKFKISLLNEFISSEIGISKYYISDKSAFPFKSDEKYIANISAEYMEFFLKFHGYIESEQTGWFRNIDGSFSEVDLPGYTNIDVILGKTYKFKDFKFVTNFSARNLLNDDTQIYGLSIRDRRFYLLFGVEF